MPDAPLPSPAPVNIPAAERPSQSGLMSLAVAVVVVVALSLGKDVLVPIVVAVLASFVLAPLADFLKRFIGRLASVLLSVLLALCVILALGGIIGTQVAQLASDLPSYQTTIKSKLEALRGITFGRFSQAVGQLGREVQKAQEPDPQAAANPVGDPGPKPLAVEVHERESTPIEFARRVLSPIVGPLESAGIILIVAVFILLHRADLRDRLIRLFGSKDLHRTTVAMDDAARRLSRFFLAQLAINTGFGILVGIGLYLIGVPSPLLWGVIAGLMRFVPYVGAFIAAIGPVTLAAAVDPGWSMVLATALLFVITEPLMGHGVEPLVYGHSTGLSPVSVIIAALFWSWLWGPIGLILSTPLTLCLVVLGRHVERLEFLDVMLGDRPALTPVENFYQRVLAGDPDEAQDHAELLLKERSLSSYYDEVALKGLQLAANDVMRGVLTETQLQRIKDAVRDLVSELDSHDDETPVPADSPEGPAQAPESERKLPKEPPPATISPEELAQTPEWRGPHPVLCIAGRGPLDEAASTMLAQLLGKHGLNARALPYEAVSRNAISRLEIDGVAMICVSYLEIIGHPSHLRYLLRRLRRRFPNARLLVGLWPAEAEVLKNDSLRAMVGADDYVTSLRQAVTACVEAARASARAAVVSQVDGGLVPEAAAEETVGAERAAPAPSPAIA